MNYGEAVKKSMEDLAKDARTLFIGYNLAHGSRAYGSLRDVSTKQIIETPIAENLMAGLSAGLSLVGFRPVLIFERHDFMLNALDGLINHIDKIGDLSNGQYTAPVIIRAIVGSRRPINPGPQHEQDFTEAFRKMLKMPVYDPKNSEEVLRTYVDVSTLDTPVMIIERRNF